MSNVNIMRAVESIRAQTNVYTPLVEVIVNSIQAIEELERSDGQVTVTVLRSAQGELAESVAAVVGFRVEDNGVGFTEEHRTSFDTLYTTKKIAEGGKGFGRFTCLKYFRDVRIESVFQHANGMKERSFDMGKQTELIVDERVTASDATDTGSTVQLLGAKHRIPDKSVQAISRSLVERLLPFFLSEDECPRIVLEESDGSGQIVLNDFLTAPHHPQIQEVTKAHGRFELEGTQGPKTFDVRVFKLYSTRSTRSRVSLVAHRREVTSTSLHIFVPEFSEEFCDQLTIEGKPEERNFVVAVYVFSDYLDEHVLVERGGFEFQREADALTGISQRDIEARAAGFAQGAAEGEVRQRREKKEERVRHYVRDQAPWHTTLLREVDLTPLPYNASDADIDAYLQREKHEREVETRTEVRRFLETEDTQELEENAAKIVQAVSETSRSELVHYVALRRSVLDILGRSLEVDEDGRYRSERVVHDVIFPRNANTDTTDFENQNLWIIDERLNFMEFVSSDERLSEESADRPDLIGFGRRIGFRGGNEPGNPVIIFEFKRPQRDDFVNPSSNEDPVEQVVRYVRRIRRGRYRTPKGRELMVSSTTPFYGYVVCDLTAKVRDWAKEEKDFKQMPDALGYFDWHDSLNLYMEILSWDKIYRDGLERNRVFFHKLGID